MALTIPYSFTNATIAEAAEVNSNFNNVKAFADALQDGSGIDTSAIVEAKLASAAVTEVKIATGAVTADKIGALAVITAKLADNSVTQVKLADRSVGSAELKEITLVTTASTAYTPILTDAQKIVTFSAATAVAFTIPTDAVVAYEIGDQINLLQLTAGGQITISAVTPGTTTVVSQGSKLKTNGQYSMATCIKIAANSWVVVGNLSV